MTQDEETTELTRCLSKDFLEQDGGSGDEEQLKRDIEKLKQAIGLTRAATNLQYWWIGWLYHKTTDEKEKYYGDDLEYNLNRNEATSRVAEWLGVQPSRVDRSINLYRVYDYETITKFADMTNIALRKAALLPESERVALLTKYKDDIEKGKASSRDLLTAIEDRRNVLTAPGITPAKKTAQSRASSYKKFMGRAEEVVEIAQDLYMDLAKADIVLEKEEQNKLEGAIDSVRQILDEIETIAVV